MDRSNLSFRMGRGVLAVVLVALFCSPLARATDTQDITARVNGLVNAYNAKNIDLAMAFFTADYLDDGETNAILRANLVNEFANTPFQELSYTSLAVTSVVGDTAKVSIQWAGDNGPWKPDFKKIGGIWYIRGNQRQFRVQVQTNNQAPRPYNDKEITIQLQVEEPTLNAITAVEVTGPGISGSISLNHDVGDDYSSWASYGTNGGNNDLSPRFTLAQRPAVGSVYTFTIHGVSTGTVVMTEPISGYVDVFPSALTPANGAVVAPPTVPTLSWVNSGGSSSFSVSVSQYTGQGGSYWSQYDILGSSLAYDGPALVDGNEYSFEVRGNDSNQNSASTFTIFVYSSTSVTSSLLAYTEDNGPVALNSAMVLGNGSGETVTGATVSFDNYYINGQDVLAFTNQNGISGSFNAGSRTLTLTGSATASTYQAALRTVTYTNTSHTPDIANRYLTVQFTTANHVSAGGHCIIQITAVNDVPTSTSINTLTGGLPNSDFTISYASLLAASNAVDLDGTPIVFRIESVTSGTLTKNGTAVTPGSTLLATGEQLVWHPAQDATGQLNAFTVKAWDGIAASLNAVTVKVNVAPPAEIEVRQNGTLITDNVSTLSFGTNILIGSLAMKSFTINNLGSADLTVGTVYLDNNHGFAVGAQPATTVAAGSSTTFSIQVQTANLGYLSARVRFSNSDGDENPFGFLVEGTVVGSGADVDSDGLDDGWELFWFPGLGTATDPNADADGDGWSNIQEYERGSDPTQYVLSLTRGWNLVALARVPRNRSVQAIFGDAISAPVWTWEKNRFNRVEILEPLRGYWIHSAQPVEIPINLP